MASCLQAGQQLINEGNPHSQRIQLKLTETKQLWDDLKELAHARQEVYFIVIYNTKVINKKVKKIE